MTAVKVALPVFAAERCAAVTPLLLSAGRTANRWTQTEIILWLELKDMKLFVSILQGKLPWQSILWAKSIWN